MPASEVEVEDFDSLAAVPFLLVDQGADVFSLEDLGKATVTHMHRRCITSPG